MSPEELQRRLRQLPLGGELFVKRDSVYAARHRFHPDAYQVWDVERVSRRPYCVLVVQRRGHPAELDDRIVERVARMQVSHNGRESWADEKVREFQHADEETERNRDKVFNHAWKEKVDVPGRVRSLFKKSKRHKLNKSHLPCASPSSSQQSATG